MTLVLVTAPAVEPLTAAEARARLSLPAGTPSDDVLNALIKAARQEIDGKDGWLGRALITQTWEIVLDRFPCGAIRLPLPPLQSVTSVTYFDGAAVEQTLAGSSYQVLAGEPAGLAIVGAWPALRQGRENVRIRFVAGYGASGSAVPEPIRMAIAMKVNLLRSMTRQDPLLRSETVDGVGSQQWAVSESIGLAVDKAAQSLLSPFRVWMP